jgi:translocation and assembly module TamA
MYLIGKPLGVLGGVLCLAALLMSGNPGLAAEGGAAETGTADPKAPEFQGIEYAPEITGVSDDDLLDLLKSAAQLYTLEDRRPATVTALERRTQNDLERLREVLRSEGYYDATLSYRLGMDERPIKVTIEVEPGTLYTLAAFTIAYEPPAPDEKARPTPADIGIKTGMPARAPAVREAETKAAAWLRDRGYPFAKSAGLKATVRHDKDDMTVRLTLNAGPRAALGALTVTGLKTVEEGYIRRIVDWPEGEPFDQRKLDGVRASLNGTGLFSSVKISHADGVAPDGRLPVAVEVVESPHRSIGLGLSYSTDVGFGGNVFWEHRNFFGRNETLNFTITGAQIEQVGKMNFRKPAFLQRDQALLATAQIANRDTDAFEQQSAAATVSLERPLLEKWRGTAGVSASYDILKDQDGERQFKLFGLPVSMTRSTADNPLNPTRGTVIDLSATPYAGIANDPVRFLRMMAGGAAYYSMDKESRFILAGRTRVGSIVGEKTDVLPADKRFYAGGGGSVRGYEYQKIGPLDSDGDPTGGRSLVELGTELRIRLTEKFGVVPFIDGGMVTEESYPSFDEPLLWAGGLGLRYYTGFGPLRLDVAFPINGRKEDDLFQFYVSFGQAF